MNIYQIEQRRIMDDKSNARIRRAFGIPEPRQKIRLELTCFWPKSLRYYLGQIDNSQHVAITSTLSVCHGLALIGGRLASMALD